jgi:hypothetical protein
MKRIILGLLLAAGSFPVIVPSPAIAEYQQNKGEVTVTSFKWQKEPDYGSNGAVRFIIAVKNNTKRYIRTIILQVTTFDSLGNPVASNDYFMDAFAPGKTKVLDTRTMDYYGTEKTASIQIVEFEYSK